MASGDVIKTRVNGKVRWFNNSFGYGFGVEDGIEKPVDIFIHYSALIAEVEDAEAAPEVLYEKSAYRLLNPGDKIIFDIVEGEEKDERDGSILFAAKNVVRIVPSST